MKAVSVLELRFFLTFMWDVKRANLFNYIIQRDQPDQRETFLGRRLGMTPVFYVL